MNRSLVLFAASAVFLTSCTPSFRNRVTPSGGFCTDMDVVPSNEEPEREYHRLQPVQSDPTAKTTAERFESLRKAACLVGGDAVIDAEETEVQNETGQYKKVFSGTAVVWVRLNAEEKNKPLTTRKKAKAEPESSAPAEPVPAEGPAPPPAEPTATATPAPTPAATPAPTPAATPAPTPTATASAAPTTTAKPTKPKLPSNPTPKQPAPKSK